MRICHAIIACKMCRSTLHRGYAGGRIRREVKWVTRVGEGTWSLLVPFECLIKNFLAIVCKQINVCTVRNFQQDIFQGDALALIDLFM